MRFEARPLPVKATALVQSGGTRALFIRFSAPDGGGGGNVRAYLDDVSVVKTAIAAARAEGEALNEAIVVGADALFVPSRDHHAGLDAALDAFARLLKLLADEELPFVWRTRGGIGDVLHPAVGEALIAAGPLATLEVGIPTLDVQLCRSLEGGRGATPDERLRLMGAASARGVAVRALLEPLVPMLSDQTASLKPLLRAIADAGAHRVAVRYLVMTRARVKVLSRRLSRMNRDLIRGCFADQPWRTKDDEALGGDLDEPHKLLPPRLRKLGHERVREIAVGLGLALDLLDAPTEAEELALDQRKARREAGRDRLKQRRRAQLPQLDLFGRKTG